MNAKILISIAILCMAQLSTASIVRRDVPVATTPSSADVIIQGLGDLFKTAIDAVDNLQKSFLGVVGVNNTEQLTNVVANKTGDYVLLIQGLLGDLQAEGQKQAGQVNELVTSATARFQESVKKLQEENPDMVNAANSYKENVGKRFEEVIEEAQKFFKTVNDQNLKNAEEAKKVVETIVQQTSATSKDILEKVNKAIEPKPAASP